MTSFLESVRGGLVAIFRGDGDVERLASACEALAGAGVQAVEVTLDTPGALTAIERLAQRFAGRLHVGAGTVLDAEATRRAVDAGAAFVVAPGLDEGTVTRALELGVPVLPGVFTPTEVLAARRLGCEAVKLFPAGPVGPGYLKALRGPIPDVAIVPTGGIGLADVPGYLAAGAHAVGLGSALTRLDADELARAVSQVTGHG